MQAFWANRGRVAIAPMLAHPDACVVDHLGPPDGLRAQQAAKRFRFETLLPDLIPGE